MGEASAPNEKPPQLQGPLTSIDIASALAGFEPTLGLVDHVDAAFAAHQTVCAVAAFQRTQGIFDFHRLGPFVWQTSGRGAKRASLLGSAGNLGLL